MINPSGAAYLDFAGNTNQFIVTPSGGFYGDTGQISATGTIVIVKNWWNGHRVGPNYLGRIKWLAWRRS